eukprot:6895192-Prymnesium_polylepis.2
MKQQFGDTVTSVAFSHDDERCAGCDMSGCVEVYSCVTAASICRQQVESGINAVIFLSSDHIAVGTFGGLIHVIPLDSEGVEVDERGSAQDQALLEESTRSTRFEGSVHSMAATRDRSKLIAGGKKVVVVFKLMEPDRDASPPMLSWQLVERLQVLYPADGVVLSLAISSSGELVVTAGDAKVVQLWTVPFGLSKRCSRGSSCSSFGGRPRCSTRMSERSSTTDSLPFAAAGDERGYAEAASFACATTVHAVAIAFSGRLLAAATATNTEVYTLQRVNHKQLESQPILRVDLCAYQGGVAFSGEGKETLAIAGANLVTVLDMETHATVRQLQRDNRVRCVGMSSDGSAVVFGGFGKTLEVHALDGGAVIQRFKCCGGDTVRCLHLSTDASVLAVGGEVQGTGRVMLFLTANKFMLACWDHDNGVWSVRISPSGALACSQLPVTTAP